MATWVERAVLRSRGSGSEDIMQGRGGIGFFCKVET